MEPVASPLVWQGGGATENTEDTEKGSKRMSHRFTQIELDQRMPIASSASSSASVGADLWLSLFLLFVMCVVCRSMHGKAEKN